MYVWMNAELVQKDMWVRAEVMLKDVKVCVNLLGDVVLAVG